MSIGNILTTGGFTKLISIPQSDENNKNKTALYRLENPSLEKIQTAKEAINLELGKGWTYEGELGTFEKDVKDKSYLLKSGTALQLFEGSETAGEHHIKVANTASYLFESLVKVGRDFNISSPNATIILNISAVAPQPVLAPLEEKREVTHAEASAAGVTLSKGAKVAVIAGEKSSALASGSTYGLDSKGLVIADNGGESSSKDAHIGAGGRIQTVSGAKGIANSNKAQLGEGGTLSVLANADAKTLERTKHQAEEDFWN